MGGGRGMTSEVKDMTRGVSPDLEVDMVGNTSVEPCAMSGDSDCDGIPTMEDCNDFDPNVTVSRARDPECDGFYLASNNVTVMCPEAALDTSGFVDGVAFSKRDHTYLFNLSHHSDEWPTICTSGIQDMSNIFWTASTFNQDISAWDTSNVTTVFNMFGFAEVFNQNIGDWDMSNVTNMSGMFYQANAFDQDISAWNTSNVTDMTAMFWGTPFNQDISGWDIRRVTMMSDMFRNTSAFDQNISNWDVSRVTDMSRMFGGAEAFDQDIGGWDVSNVTDMSEMFSYTNAFDQDLSDWCVERFSRKPSNFDYYANAWFLERPVWGTCPSN